MSEPKVMGRDYIFRGLPPQKDQQTFFSNVYDDSDGLARYGMPWHSRDVAEASGSVAPRHGPGRLLYRIKFTLKAMEHSG